MKKIRIGRWVVRWQWLVIILSAVIVCTVVVCRLVHSSRRSDLDREIASEVDMLYGYDRSKYEVVEGVVAPNQTLSHLLDGCASIALIDNIARTAKPTYDFRGMRVGNKYALFLEPDSTHLLLRHLVYEKNSTDLIYVSVAADGTVAVREEQKQQTLVRRVVTADIDSSLWNCIADHNLPPSLAVELEDIFGWSINFFALQTGDEFTVIFDERYIEDKRVGTGTIWGVVFHHGGRDYYAFPFDQNGKLEYWDENGKSMRKQFLKAPLKFTRISSKYGMRVHPINHRRQMHKGVDYAAPKGTPVMAIADGKVTAKFWDNKGGGNVLKITHANGYVSMYLHLNGYAKGIKVGKHVSQGQLVAYVGTTGGSTGPHLDFRVTKNGSFLNPTNLPSNSVQPISQSNRSAFDKIRGKVMTEFSGVEMDDDERLSIYDLYPSRRKSEPLTPDEVMQKRLKTNPVSRTLSKLTTKNE
ncbi:MAG: M23 family metallopeptidase [Tidjanibacter sp.]|nr:M23 family metallopeptidase [Tidjanibacter sp.]